MTTESKPRTKKEAPEIDPEAQAQADAQLEKMNSEQDQPKAKTFGGPRTRGSMRNVEFVADKEMPLSKYAPGLDPEYFGPTAFAATHHGKRTGSAHTQEFILDEERCTYLHFTAPGQNLPKKRLYTIKAFHRDGRLVQLPFELQIQNNAGGDPIDAIGLRRYQRKGMSVLIDWNTMQPIYCAAWGCYAKADGRTGFCSHRHSQHTLPNRFSEAGELSPGMRGVFGENATTSRIWNS